MTIAAREASRPFETNGHAPTISFKVPAVPVAQPRQKNRVVTKNGKPIVMRYTEERHPVQTFRVAIQTAFSAAHAGPPIDGPVGVSILFVMPRPKSMTWKSRPMPRVHRRSGRGDWDNLAKAFTDALKHLAWRDDSQIAYASVEIKIAAGDEQPCAHATIWELS
jgi:Holliday junction resolvase RusA-like endonuclease